jgi:F-type H+-transporting ATPase subunit delta
MTNRTAAVRYARALFDVNLESGDDLRKAESDLDLFARLVDEHEGLRRVLFAAAVQPPKKRAIINDLRNRFREVSPTVTRLLTVLADRGRLALLPDILRFYRARVFEHLGVVDAEVTTAQPLSPAQDAAVRQRLAAAGAGDVRVTTIVDPDILGGVVTRIGSTVYDGSVARHLERMRQTLLDR